MALKATVDNRLNAAFRAIDWCGHELAPDFKLARVRRERGGSGDDDDEPMPLAARTRSGAGGALPARCGECDEIDAAGRRCDDCARTFCAGCQDFSYAGYVAVDAFVCYRCHPNHDVRKTPRRGRSISRSVSSTVSFGRRSA